jgi:dipeptidyl aminopeptidase/acylaminoacyl peptidase
MFARLRIRPDLSFFNTLSLLILSVLPQNITAQESPATAVTSISLEQIMADPDWLGRAPEGGFFADDGASFYYRRKRAGSAIEDWFQADSEGNLIRVVEDDQRGEMDVAEGSYAADFKRKVYSRNGDLFVKHLDTGRIQQLTRTKQGESSPRFMADNRRVMYRRGDTVVARNLRSGLEEELIDLRLEADPAEQREKSRQGYLAEQQQHLFEVLRKERAQADERRAQSESLQEADRTASPRAWYLGDKHRVGRLEVSPSGQWCVVSLESKGASDGKGDQMPEWVTADGYVGTRGVRPLVGTGKFSSDRLVLLNLRRRETIELSFKDLPHIADDPFVEVRQSVEKWRQETEKANEVPPASDQTASAAKQASSEKQGDNQQATQETSKERAVVVRSVVWNAMGTEVAVELIATDNKDRWITVVDFAAKALKVVSHQRDPAWINRGLGSVQWMADGHSLVFLSEETGYAHLYVAHVPSGSKRQLTSGNFEVSDILPSRDGQHVYYKANAKHPGVYEIYRVRLESGSIEQLTDLGGMNDYRLSGDEKHLLVTHSTAVSPAELWIQPLDGVGAAKQVTRTVSAEFSALPWVAPQFITIPSRAGNGLPIHCRLYLPPDHDSAKKYPAVIFIHGAGYLQNAHQGWSIYFREFMFHSLLAQRGYVVLDLDYRASAGYGRDWRTAIYRQMGSPEVEDLEDSRRWLGEYAAVDVDRVGLYGGSYGGFLTMMALFKKPGMFACGAALRPVTDWAHYNHGYTANILNTPEIDPEAYAKSSPIELAEGLADPLLICHGMVDDNVFFKDTARLAQRLIELRKADWEVAIYPVEAHGFVQPSSWYDEYRRILRLFEQHLQ